MVLLCCACGAIRHMRHTGTTGFYLQSGAFAPVIMGAGSRQRVPDAGTRQKKCNSYQHAHEAPHLSPQSEERTSHAREIAFALRHGNQPGP